MTTKTILASMTALALALGTAGCGSEAEQPAAAAPEAPAGITVTGASLSLPAVAGNPGAVYFTFTNAGDQSATIRSAEMLGSSSAVLHETSTWNLQVDMQELFQLPVAAGEEVVFEPGGKHVMVYELDDSLQVGGETEMTLTFVGGDKISFPVAIRAAGDDGAMGDMEGM